MLNHSGEKPFKYILCLKLLVSGPELAFLTSQIYRKPLGKELACLFVSSIELVSLVSKGDKSELTPLWFLSLGFFVVSSYTDESSTISTDRFLNPVAAGKFL